MITKEWKDKEAFYVEHDCMESALQMKDDLRDEGVCATLPTIFEKWTVKISYEYVLENFERNYLGAWKK